MGNGSNQRAWKFIISVFVTILIAVAGYFYTWLHDQHRAQHEARLERVNRQLRDLYGPLYALVEAEELSFQYFLEETTPDRPSVGSSYPNHENPPTERQSAAWRRWIQHVTMPNYMKMEEIIIQHSDLLLEDEIPPQLLKLSAHIIGYKPVLAAWSDGDFSRNCSFFEFPMKSGIIFGSDTESSRRSRGDCLV